MTRSLKDIALMSGSSLPLMNEEMQKRMEYKSIERKMIQETGLPFDIFDSIVEALDFLRKRNAQSKSADYRKSRKRARNAPFKGWLVAVQQGANLLVLHATKGWRRVPAA